MPGLRRNKQTTRGIGISGFVVILMMLLIAPIHTIGADRKTRHSAVGAESWRRLPPKSGPVRELTLPKQRALKLDNGLEVILVEDHRSPMVTVLAGIPLKLKASSDLSAMTNEAAVAEATAELVTEGAGSRTSEILTREIESLGAHISSSATSDHAEVTASVISENLDRLLGLFADILLRPNFPEEEVALFKRNRLQNLVVQRQDPAYLTGEQFDRVIFGSHPYSISSPTAASIEALDRDKIRQFFADRFAPAGSVVAIVGDFRSESLESKVRALFGDWKNNRADAGRKSSTTFPEITSRRIYLIDRPGSEQSDFRIGGIAVSRANPDYFPLLVANAILGGGTNSRLFLNIRERQGFAYDVYSSVDPLLEAGSFYGGAETRPEVTARAIQQMLLEFDRLRRMPVPVRELQGAKNYLNGLFSISLATQGGIVSRIAQERLMALGEDYVENYRSRIEAVTAADIQRVAAKYMRSDRAAIVVVGDAGKLRKQLETIGKIEMVTISASGKSRPVSHVFKTVPQR